MKNMANGKKKRQADKTACFFLCIANHSFGIKRSSSLTKVVIKYGPCKFFNIIFVNNGKKNFYVKQCEKNWII